MIWISGHMNGDRRMYSDTLRMGILSSFIKREIITLSCTIKSLSNSGMVESI